MSRIEYLIMTVIDSMITMACFLKIFGTFEKGQLLKALIFVIGLTGISRIVSSFNDISALTVFVNAFAAYFLILVIFRRKAITGLVQYMTVYLLCMMINLISIQILSFIWPSFSNEFQSGLLAQGLSVCIVVILLFIDMGWIRYYIEDANSWFQRIVVSTFMGHMLILFIWHTDFQEFERLVLVIVLYVSATVSINTMIARNGLLNIALMEKNRMYEVYIPMINDAIDDIRVRQHDFNNHIAVLDALANNKGYAEYSERIQQDMIWQNILRLDSQVMVALLYSKYKDATDRGIDFTVSNSLVTMDVAIEDYILIEIMGELINNAIRAAEATDEKKVKVSIEQVGREYEVAISNSTKDLLPEDVPKMFRKGYTTKETSGHGYGLWKIRKDLEKENCTITYSYDAATSVLAFIVEMPKNVKSVKR